ncbi:histidine kinase-like protein [Murinocardiopsis flavida]|uniref:Histidine kinase-like protein n=1 Tax=Murinocardiopsis flavida TaxID=645275 RepID=A0A2P8D6W1_9ACTN|nr:ATP-binding protein [Murinocardiopsis flavida]PSK92960.1 histidine kinase-like protein [Murinocardiopsis flavida]
MPAVSILPPLPSVTIPLALLIPSGKESYFDSAADPVPFTRRAFQFRGEKVLMPLVHAFLASCATHGDGEYRYVFDLLGTELVGNALRHSRSGEPGGTYTLRVDRSTGGLTLTCRDEGEKGGRRYDHRERHYLSVPEPDIDPLATAGRGLAIVDALSTSWGDNGFPSHRQVWCYLAFDLAGSAWRAG